MYICISTKILLNKKVSKLLYLCDVSNIGHVLWIRFGLIRILSFKRWNNTHGKGN